MAEGLFRVLRGRPGIESESLRRVQLLLRARGELRRRGARTEPDRGVQPCLVPRGQPAIVSAGGIFAKAQRD